jgi:hypothetical protein
MKKLLVPGLLLVTGCASTAAVYVPAGSPLLAICQSAQGMGLPQLDAGIDHANNTNPQATWGQGFAQPLDASTLAALKADASLLSADSARAVPAGRDFAAALLSLSQEYRYASVAPDGFVSNQDAIETDTYTAEVAGDCASYQPALAGAASLVRHKPRPAIWDWPLFGIVTAGYALAVLLCSFLLARAERAKPRMTRMTSGKVIGWSLIWWLTFALAGISTWKAALSRLQLTPDDRRDDRMAEQEAMIAASQAEYSKLEKQLKKK